MKAWLERGLKSQAWGWITTWLVVFVPILVLFWAGFGLSRGVLGFAFLAALLAWVGLLVKADAWLLAGLQLKQPPQGIEFSWQRSQQTSERLSVAVPQFFLLEDSAPMAMALRGAPFGWRQCPATVVLSQGLFDALTEPELRAVLAMAALRLEEPGQVLRTFVSSLAARLLQFAPRGWKQELLLNRSGESKASSRLSAGQLLGFSALWALASVLMKAAPVSQIQPKSEEGAGRSEFFLAQQKARNLNWLWGARHIPGTGHLLLFAPRPSGRADLLSFSST